MAVIERDPSTAAEGQLTTRATRSFGGWFGRRARGIAQLLDGGGPRRAGTAASTNVASLDRRR